MLKQVIFISLLSVIAFTCSGCATILGGIIGYQSGELAAGMAIGAAVDFGDDIARGIGQMTAKKKDLSRDFQKKSTFNAQNGSITLPICPFNQKRTMDLAQQLRDKMEQEGWTCKQVEKTVCDPLISPDLWKETWQCSTETGQSFTFKIDFRSNRDTQFQVSSLRTCGKQQESQVPPPLTPEQITEITSQIYKWMEQLIAH